MTDFGVNHEAMVLRGRHRALSFECIDTYRSLLLRCAAENKGGDIGWLYRGQAAGSWPEPKLNRGDKAKVALGNFLRKETTQCMSAFVEKRRQIGNQADAATLMQHYGAPTNFLDWSDSPLVALSFAVNARLEDIEQGKSGELTVWVVHADAEDWSQDGQDDLARGAVRFWRPTISDLRVELQGSVFSVHKVPDGELEMVEGDFHFWSRKMKETKLFKVGCSDDSLDRLKVQLEECGISRKHLLPECPDTEAICGLVGLRFEKQPMFRQIRSSVSISWQQSISLKT